MKEKPVLFNAEMVRAILSGQKTQTRRPIKLKDPRFNRIDLEEGLVKESFSLGGCWHVEKKHKCPFGQVGGELWARETFFNEDGTDFYYADQSYVPDIPEEWLRRNCGKPTIPSIHMPRWASRIQLKVKRVWVERVNDISEEDSMAEGICYWNDHPPFPKGFKDYLEKGEVPTWCDSAKESFQTLWNSIYNTWDQNPWVWACEFERVVK